MLFFGCQGPHSEYYCYELYRKSKTSVETKFGRARFCRKVSVQFRCLDADDALPHSSVLSQFARGETDSSTAANRSWYHRTSLFELVLHVIFLVAQKGTLTCWRPRDTALQFVDEIAHCLEQGLDCRPAAAHLGTL